MKGVRFIRALKDAVFSTPLPHEIKNLFEPLLTGQTDIGSGKIIDFTGFQSQETDVIIYSKNIHPAILYSHRTDIGIYPAETCIYAIEVKSKATAPNIRDAIEKGKTLRNLKYSTGLYDPFGRGIPHQVTPAIPAFFAFSTDLTEKSEIDRYIELDPEGEFSPVIPVICVAGKGYWYYRRDTTPNGDSIGKWWHWAPTADYLLRNLSYPFEPAGIRRLASLPQPWQALSCDVSWSWMRLD